MFELPEYTILAGQINETLNGKRISNGLLGNSPHKFVWYNRSHEEFNQLTEGKTVGTAWVKGRWLFYPPSSRLCAAAGRMRGQSALSSVWIKAA